MRRMHVLYRCSSYDECFAKAKRIGSIISEYLGKNAQVNVRERKIITPYVTISFLENTEDIIFKEKYQDSFYQYDGREEELLELALGEKM